MNASNAEYIYFPSDLYDYQTNLNGAFGGCYRLKTMSLNTANVEVLSYLFYDNNSLEEVTLTSFNNCTTMANMFNGCNSLYRINVDSWNTPNLTDTSYMFKDCSSLIALDLIDLNMSNVSSYDGMFDGCYNLNSIYCNNQETYDKLLDAVTAAGLLNCTVYCDVCGGGDTPDVPSGDQYVRVDLNGQWEMSSENVFDSGYVTYNSFSNKGQGNSTAIMRLYVKGYDTYSFKYMSDAESSWDYMIIMQADTNWDGGNGLYNTRGKQNQILDATYTFDDPSVEHFIEIIYKKDSSVDQNRDCGFIGIMQEVLAEEWRMSETEYIKDGEIYFTKEYKWITFDNQQWYQTNEYQTGYQLTTGITTVDGYICSSGNKYSKEEIIFYDHPYITNSGEYVLGDMIEENAEDCQFISDFMFNYNFDNFNEESYVLSNHPDANFQQDLQLQGSLSLNNDGEHKYATINYSSAYGVFDFGDRDNNPFNCSNGESITFIFKTKGGNNGTDLISCRGSQGYNWMVRPYRSYATLHTGNGECGQINYNNSDEPNVIAITFDGVTVKYYNLTDGTYSECSNGNWGSYSEILVFFASMYSGISNGISEQWDGDCYWMFCAKRLLSENEMNIVADFNGR